MKLASPESEGVMEHCWRHRQDQLPLGPRAYTVPAMNSQRKKPSRHRLNRLEVLYEDRDLLVVCKDPGLLTNSYRGDKNPTAEHQLTGYLRKGNSRSRLRVFTVHRLDRETSGLLIFAKSKIVQEKLRGNWKAVEKHYTAVVHGCLEVKSGKFSSYLAENKDQFVYSTSDATRGKWSETRYQVVNEALRFSLLDITLLTGRKNQIRVHLAEAGYPVVGDPKYGAKRKRASRMALHARTLAFPHPHDGRQMEFEAPVPEEILGLMNGD